MPRRRTVLPVELPPFVADAGSSTPLYAQVVGHIATAIDRGLLAPGDRLEGEIGLSQQFGVSRQTMRHAIDQLVERGVLMRKHGVGTQVAPQRFGRVHGVSSLFDELSSRGLKPLTQVIRADVGPAPHFAAEALEVGDGADVLCLVRLRFVDDRPFAIMRNWLRTGSIDLDEFDLVTGGLYEGLRATGLRMSLAQQSIGAEAADDVQASLLGISIGAPLLTIHSTTFVDLGRPIEHGRHDYLPSKYRFEVTKYER